ncbi:MAG: hypothetical protein KDA85_20780, partial [Planctomycetaceae bacterium]|nr:hypothetical protein [Planctomycetaceae bacterium]
SVRVNLDIPEDYQSREFRSIGDSVQVPSALTLVIQRSEQIWFIRCLAALSVVIVCWWTRKASLLKRITLAGVAVLLACAAIPLVANIWQPLLDGVLLGLVPGVLIWTAHGFCVVMRRLLPIAVQSAAVRSAALMLVALTVAASDGVAQQANGLKGPQIVVPYNPDEPALRSDRVFVPHDEFIKLYRLAEPNGLPESLQAPITAEVIAAYYRSTAVTDVTNTQQIADFTARYVAVCPDDQMVQITLPIGDVAVGSVTVDGHAGTLLPVRNVPVPVQAEPNQQPAQQQALPQPPISQVGNQAPNGSPMLRAASAAYQVQLQGKGLHTIDLTFRAGITLEGKAGRFELPLLPVAAGTMEFTLPADELDVRINGRTNTFRQDGRVVILPIAGALSTRVSWQPATRKHNAETDIRAESTTALAVGDSSLRWHTTIQAEARQGEFSELDVVIPDNYAVQSVSGPDVAGWTVQNTDQQRSVRLTLQRAVTDKTQVTLQLYASHDFSQERNDLQIPIPQVRGATSDRGTILLLAGSQFQVGGDGITGVTRIDLQDAPLPQGDTLDGNRQRAWRFARHPAEIQVRLSPTADELRIAANHAARMETQRTLWASRYEVDILGTPRGRLDILVPDDFLPLDVQATDLQDWYLSPPAESDPRRILSLQLTGARRGRLQVVIQGQRDRNSDRTQLILDPPELTGTT